ncbi:sterol desaturase family protein [Oleiphilus messinensis]|uniref:sterol desaturase family protein n=1 Tax=Oleiphilus messinensis TaxID=141451 RepID=UPI000B3B68AD|nr:sterol desaturase family protein [Oleiphilus messinensis]
MTDLLHAIGFILTFGMLFVGIIIAEAWYWHKKGNYSAKTGKTVYDFRETIASISTGAIYKIADGIMIAVVITALYDVVYQWGFQYVPDDGLWSVLLIFFAVDFVFYWYHRTMHTVRWLWTGHVTHHSSTRMNFSTALRQNFLYDLNFGWLIWWLPIAFIGFDKNWAIIAIELNLAYQFFIHTETVNKLGWFEKVFNTPSHHRVHHGSNPAQIDTNFGGVLIIWDKLFGTFVDEKDAGDIRYGLTLRQPNTLNPVRLCVDEFICMVKDVARYRDWRILYKGPNWVEETYGARDNASPDEEARHKSITT